MIPNAELAQHLLNIMEECCRKLRESVDLVRLNCSEADYIAYRGEVAQISGRIFYLLMDPIYHQFPQLAPPEAPLDLVNRWQRPKGSEPGEE